MLVGVGRKGWKIGIGSQSYFHVMSWHVRYVEFNIVYPIP